MSTRIVHIASNTFREAVRDRVLYSGLRMRRVVDANPSRAFFGQRGFRQQSACPLNTELGDQIRDLIGESVPLNFRSKKNNRRLRSADQTHNGHRELLLRADRRIGDRQRPRRYRTGQVPDAHVDLNVSWPLHGNRCRHCSIDHCRCFGGRAGAPGVRRDQFVGGQVSGILSD